MKIKKQLTTDQEIAVSCRLADIKDELRHALSAIRTAEAALKELEDLIRADSNLDHENEKD